MGAFVSAYDPVAMTLARSALDELSVDFARDEYEALRGADALLILTDWPQFSRLDLRTIYKELRLPIVIDGRNVYEPAMMHSLGFTYRGMGRGTGPAPSVLPSDSISTQPLTAEIESD
jgi:UDPglucose 6-dehydrogenase